MAEGVGTDTRGSSTRRTALLRDGTGARQRRQTEKTDREDRQKRQTENTDRECRQADRQADRQTRRLGSMRAVLRGSRHPSFADKLVRTNNRAGNDLR